MDNTNDVGAEQMRMLGHMLKNKLPKGYGFCLLVFETDKPGVSNYISTAVREDMIKALFETAYRLKDAQDFETKRKFGK